MNKVRDLTEDNPAEQKNIEALQKEIELAENHLEDVINLRKKNFGAAEEMVASGTGKTYRR